MLYSRWKRILQYNMIFCEQCIIRDITSITKCNVEVFYTLFDQMPYSANLVDN